ncbi:MAG: ATP-binding protein [Paludibacteraceae bacterium]|nr:ATP-binding protein [Paludibacteraceae bacterium]
MINRDIVSEIVKDFGKGKVIVILGPRQTGKTTLLEQIATSYDDVFRLNCDDYDDASRLTHQTSTELKTLLGNHRLILIDEAQRVENIGLTLKIMADLKTKTQIIATGSSSLDLANRINEPATGRLFEYRLYPFTVHELIAHTDQRTEQRMLSMRMIYGSYPEIITNPNDAKRLLSNIVNSYLYRDILGFNGIKRPQLLQKLVRALALQVGSEVSYNELSNLLGADRGTIESYISLLEQCFVIFTIQSYSRNLRNEIKKGRKIYFYDNGVRNALLNNFAPLDLRNDVGMLWENYMISERVKRNSYLKRYSPMYFWRTVNQQEIDLIEEEDGHIYSFEFKWNSKKQAKQPTAFKNAYPGSLFKCITPENYIEWLNQ